MVSRHGEDCRFRAHTTRSCPSKAFLSDFYRNFSPSCRGHWLLRLAVSLAQLSQSSPLALGRRVPPTTVLNVVSRGERFATELNPLPDTFLRPSAPPCARGPFVTSCFPPLPPPALHRPLPPFISPSHQPLQRPSLWETWSSVVATPPFIGLSHRVEGRSSTSPFIPSAP